ncbi:MAG: helix-turn-helix domain-containing protein, partial [Victivallaceae bacterium]|nr:helix-turn-helix domain-containing protein [Victivallaceae bacterium]
MSRTGRPKKKVILTQQQEEELKTWPRSRSLSHSLVIRSKIILLAAAEVNNASIAQKLDLNPSTVAKWRRRFIEDGIQGLHDEYRSGKPRTYTEEHITKLLKKTIETKPAGETHWSCRSMAEECGISKATVNR